MTQSAPVVLFDGVCNLCNASVQFLLRHERQPELRFASLQSDYGQSQMAHFGLGLVVESVVLIEGQRVYLRSAAALRLLRYLRFPWPLLQIIWLMPRPLRDLVYDWIGRNRYRWFGQLAACPLPTPELSHRFIE